MRPDTEALAKLTALQRYVVLEKIDGLSLAEIAAKSKRSKSTIQQALEGATKKLLKAA